MSLKEAKAKAKEAKLNAPKFTQNTEAYVKLNKMFEDNEISATDRPAEIFKRDPLFAEFSHQQFRSQFNKLKTKYGTNTREGKKFGGHAFNELNNN
jgi:hypothetical protein